MLFSPAPHTSSAIDRRRVKEQDQMKSQQRPGILVSVLYLYLTEIGNTLCFIYLIVSFGRA